MTRTSQRLWIWLPIAMVAILLIGLLAGPIGYGFECYRLHANGERAEARVVAADLEETLVLRIVSGSRAGQHCTADTSEAHRADLAPGDPLDVVLPATKPDECVLVATLDNSILLLWILMGVAAMAVLLLVMIGIVIDRSTGRPASLATCLDHAGTACPRCDAPMSEGYLPLMGPLHWREPEEPVGFPTPFSGLPGTFAWRGRPCLHAWRCEPCEIVTLRYGLPAPGSSAAR